MITPNPNMIIHIIIITIIIIIINIISSPSSSLLSFHRSIIIMQIGRFKSYYFELVDATLRSYNYKLDSSPYPIELIDEIRLGDDDDDPW
jgi:hypothetical protein